MTVNQMQLAIPLAPQQRLPWMRHEDGALMAEQDQQQDETVTAVDCENDPRPFGDVIRAWTNMHGWTDAEAARRIGVPYKTLRNWVPAVTNKTVGRPVVKEGGAAPRKPPLLDLPLRRLMDSISRDIARAARRKRG